VGARSVGDTLKKIDGVVDVVNGIENTISGPASCFKVDPVVPRAPGSRRRKWNWMRAPFCRASRRRAGGGERSLVHHSRAVSGATRARRWIDPQHHAGERHRKDRDARHAGRFHGRSRADGIRRDDLQRDVQVTARFEGSTWEDGMETVQKAIAD
jgi:hypothetical protein